MEDSKSLIFGKNDIENIVGCEVYNDVTTLFVEHPTHVEEKTLPNKYLLLSAHAPDPGWYILEGGLHYQYVKMFDKQKQYWQAKQYYRDTFSISDSKEAAMVSTGFTYFKGMKIEQVSVLAFDIETTGLLRDASSKVLLISNTYRKGGNVVRKLFACDDYENEADMLKAWCHWVQVVNPAILLGHNIFMYDLPYLQWCADKAQTPLTLGRHNQPIRFGSRESAFRFDGSQEYSYYRCYIFGREVVDTMFLSMKYDFARKYENYKLKQIIHQEHLEVQNRQFYDAASIKDNYTNPKEWEKIKQYAIHDADDALAIFDLMAPPFFYLNQSIPKSFQSLMYSASGSQINSFLIRSYLQSYHSLPQASQEASYEGAISFGKPGVYKDVFKIDVASLYPSIMLEYNVCDEHKDPKRHFTQMVSHFTAERLKNKKMGKDTGDRYYKDLEQAQKIVINSAYGMLGAKGLLFNSPANAAFVTRKGREILQTAIDWAEDAGFLVANADTDSVSLTRESPLSSDDKTEILKNVNALYPEKIRFEDDGYFQSVLILKAKNYVLFDGVKKKIKGSALKSSKIEPAIKEFMGKAIDRLLSSDIAGLKSDYLSYVKEIYEVVDISRWCSKKTVSEKVIASGRTTEKKIYDAVREENPQMGDKHYLYFAVDGTLKLSQNWTQDHDKSKLYGRLYKTIEVFENVLDIKQFPNFALKGNYKLLGEVTDETPVFSFCKELIPF